MEQNPHPPYLVHRAAYAGLLVVGGLFFALGLVYLDAGSSIDPAYDSYATYFSEQKDEDSYTIASRDEHRFRYKHPDAERAVLFVLKQNGQRIWEYTLSNGRSYWITEDKEDGFLDWAYGASLKPERRPVEVSRWKVEDFRDDYPDAELLLAVGDGHGGVEYIPDKRSSYWLETIVDPVERAHAAYAVKRQKQFSYRITRERHPIPASIPVFTWVLLALGAGVLWPAMSLRMIDANLSRTSWAWFWPSMLVMASIGYASRILSVPLAIFAGCITALSALFALVILFLPSHDSCKTKEETGKIPVRQPNDSALSKSLPQKTVSRIVMRSEIAMNPHRPRIVPPQTAPVVNHTQFHSSVKSQSHQFTRPDSLQSAKTSWFRRTFAWFDKPLTTPEPDKRMHRWKYFGFSILSGILMGVVKYTERPVEVLWSLFLVIPGAILQINVDAQRMADCNFRRTRWVWFWAVLKNLGVFWMLIGLVAVAVGAVVGAVAGTAVGEVFSLIIIVLGLIACLVFQVYLQFEPPVSWPDDHFSIHPKAPMKR